MGLESGKRTGLMLFLSFWVAGLFHGCHQSISAAPAVRTESRADKQSFTKGIWLYRQGRYAESIQWIERSLDGFKGLEEYQYYYLLLANRKLGKCQEVIDLSRRFEKRFPDSLLVDEVLCEEARCHHEGDAYPIAADIYRRLMDRGSAVQSSQKRKIQLEYAHVLRDLGQIEEAHSVYVGIRKQWPRTLEGLRAREAIQALREQFPRFRPSGASAMMEEADLILAEGAVTESLAMYRAIIERMPDTAARLDACFGEILCLVRSGRLAEAEGKAEFLLGSYPVAIQTRKALFSVGKACWVEDRSESAKKLLKQLVEYYGRSDEAAQGSYILGRIYLEEGAIKESAKQFMETRLRYQDTAWEKEARWYEAWSRYLGGEHEVSGALFSEVLSKGVDKHEAPKALYWRARSIEKVGRREESQAIYGQILNLYQESYYWMLAARRLYDPASGTSFFRRLAPADFPPAFLIQPIALPDSQIADLLEVGLAREAIERVDLMRNGPTTTGSSPLECIKAYYAAGAYTKAILMAQSELSRVKEIGSPDEKGVEKDLLTTAYPLFYWDLIQTYSAQAGVDPLLLAALIRQESHFMPTSISSAGALGLMQIMPQTAKHVSATLGMPVEFDPESLRDPETNIKVGTRYVAELAQRHAHQWIKVLAEYNAGEKALQKWLGRQLHTDMEEFVENISFPETQQYIKKVLFNWGVYRELYQKHTIAHEG